MNVLKCAYAKGLEGWKRVRVSVLNLADGHSTVSVTNKIFVSVTAGVKPEFTSRLIKM